MQAWIKLCAMRVPYIACLALVSMLTTACQTTQVSAPPRADRQFADAEKLSREKQYAAAARIYESAASNQSGELKNRVLLRAAREWLRASDVNRAQALLQTIGDQLPPSDLIARQLLASQIALQTRQPQRALAELDRIPAPLPREYAADILEARSQALFAYGRPVGAVMTALDREQMLSDANEIERNRRQLWDGVQRSAASGLNMQAPAGASRAASGWLELGRAALALGRNPFAAQAPLNEWRTKYPDHPANDLLNRYVLPQLDAATIYPDRIALLLPLSGRQQIAGAAVRDGFLAASLQQMGDRRPVIRVYDTAAGAAAAYQQALTDGVQYIVGPLLKEEIQQILAAQSTADSPASGNAPAMIPMLALNTLADTPADAPPVGSAQLFQFALDPVEEAEQVAARLVNDGRRFGLALVPSNEWGQRVQRAFETRLAELGGGVVMTRTYDPAAKDFSDPIRTALLINESRARANALSAALGTRLEFEPRSRGDVEFVFIAAQPGPGRLLRPALRFHLVDDLPVYSLSQIYEPDSPANAELEGVLFPDMPWVIAPDDVATQLRNTLTRYWPSRMRGNARLFAFGFDAYRLIPLLQAHRADLSAAATPGMTGLLSVDANGRVRRQLDWARVINGQARPIVPLATETQVKN